MNYRQLIAGIAAREGVQASPEALANWREVQTLCRQLSGRTAKELKCIPVPPEMLTLRDAVQRMLKSRQLLHPKEER